MDLFNQVKEKFSEEIIEQISSYIGADSIRTNKAISVALPSLISGIAASGKSASSASKIFDIIKGFVMDSNTENEISANSDLTHLEKNGGNLLEKILGNDTISSLTKVISTESGLSSSSANQLINVVAPIVMGAMHKGNSSSDFFSFLETQGKSVAGLLPLGITTILDEITDIGDSLKKGASSIVHGAENIADTIGDGAKKAVSGLDDIAEEGGGLFKKLLPLLLTLLLLFFLYMFFQKSCTSDFPASPIVDSISNESTENTLDSFAIAAKNTWASTLGAMISHELPNGTKISIPENGIENQLINYLDKGCEGDMKAHWFNMDRLLFETGSATLNKVSMEQITTLATILNAYPTSKFKVGGYTDNTGDASFNKTLSGERAAAIMNNLTTNGIDSTRLSSEGYGAEHPVCPENNTEECKEKNRRVALRVTQCK